MKLSVLLTYYDAPEYLRECLASLRRNPATVPCEVIVVDDASTVPCADIVADECPQARLIVNERNLGFAGANNVAWRAARGQHVLFLNTDTEVGSGALDELVGYLDAHPEAGAVGPMVLNTDGSFQPQCKRGWLTPLSGLAYSLRLDRVFSDSPTISEYLMRYAPRDEIQRVRALSGCCMMFRRRLLEEHGGLDESLRQYGEDLDLCYRIGEAGHEIVYDPGARIVHHGGKGGTNIRVVRSLFFFHRSLWVIFVRYRRSEWFWVYSWFVLAMLGLRFGLASIPLLMGIRRAGTRKGARRFLKERDPDVGSGDVG